MSRLKGITALGVASTLAMPALLAVPVAGLAQIDEIVVSTRRKEESLQDVPIAVQAITSEQITRQGITSLDDVVKLAPSVQFDNSFGPSDTRITIRGLSNTRGRSNVAFLVDGIDVTTENLITAGSGLLANRRLLNDVERIELVKGPQSALYGRSAFSGAISYVSKEPGTEAEGKFGIDMGEDGQRQIDFSYGGPVKGMEDVLGLRASGVWWDEKGRYINSVSGNDVGGSDGFGGALTGVFTPIDAVKIKARVEYSDEHYEPRPVVRIGGGLPLELRPTADGSQDNTWPYTIIQPGQPGNENGTTAIRVTTDANNDGLPDVNPADYTCQPGNTFVLFPKTALDADIGVGTTFGNTALGLADFGPGFCVPKSFGNGFGQQVKFSEDPFTGEDYTGTDTQTFRASLQMSFDAGFGTFSSYTGYTDFNGFDTYDQDYQAQGRPDTLLGHQQARTENDTEQFSQELRFASDWDGPLQTTLGAYYWQERRQLLDQNVIVFCAPVAKVGGKYGVPVSGAFQRQICDGTNGTVTSWQERFLDLPVSGFNNGLGVDDPYINGSYWKADTDHWSFYANIEWQFLENFKLTIEDRLVLEEFTLFKPNQSSCTNTGFSPGNNLAPLDDENIVNPFTDDIVCESEQVLNDNIQNLPPQFQGPDWLYVQGSESSNYHTPKATIEWTPSDDTLVYFYWARARKPGGINQLVAGGFPAPSIDSDRFDSEQLDAWELGTKTAWDFLGYLQLNGAAFFQDYTDKQVSTQVVVDGQLQPRVLNAGAAEVWGLEVEAIWQPEFVEGLTMSAAWTWLDAEYTDFILDSASLIRGANNAECNVVTLIDGSKTCRFDLAGNKLERTPENSVVLQANYTHQFGSADFDWFVETNASWTDERFSDEDNTTVFDAYWLVDLRLGLQGEHWDAIAYVDNLLDDDTIRTGGSGPDFGEQVTYTGFTAGFGVSHYFGQLPDPRTIGVRIGYRF